MAELRADGLAPVPISGGGPVQVPRHVFQRHRFRV